MESSFIEFVLSIAGFLFAVVALILIAAVATVCSVCGVSLALWIFECMAGLV